MLNALSGEMIMVCADALPMTDALSWNAHTWTAVTCLEGCEALACLGLTGFFLRTTGRGSRVMKPLLRGVR